MGIKYGRTRSWRGASIWIIQVKKKIWILLQVKGKPLRGFKQGTGLVLLITEHSNSSIEAGLVKFWTNIDTNLFLMENQPG